MAPVDLALAVFLSPLAAAALIAMFLRKQGGLAAGLSILACLVVTVGGLDLALTGARFNTSWTWLQFGSFAVDIGIKFDDLAALMLSIVGIVGLCVHVFSLTYMADDAAKARYFGGLSIFLFSMIGIVLASNLFMMFLFWELVGFSSYTLINHWHERPQAAAAAKKAFIVNRVGDVGFLIGIIMCYWVHGTVDLTKLAAQAQGGAIYSRAIALLLFCGAVGKSAQLPLQVWLPDAMEGPTPISALIHAATMVAAGIYMLCRVDVLMVDEARHVICWVGTATALYAALCAIVQRDIKKVLAYSTLSQLGYMVAAFGLGSLEGRSAGVGAAMFHLTTHAFFKALLFLGSGSVIYACHHEQDIFKMGGLRSRLPITFWTFTIGVAAIIGLPFFAGFFSKDAILYLALANNKGVFAVLAFTAALTGFYMVRVWWIVFFGQPRDEHAEHAHEGGVALTAPLAVLALLSVGGGYLSLYPKVFGGVLNLVPEATGSAHGIILGTSLLVLLAGAGSALLLYKKPVGAVDTLQLRSPALFGGLVLLRNSFDALYDYYVAKIQQRLAMVLNFIDIVGIAGVLVRGAAGFAAMAGMGVRALHTGRISSYALWFFLGVALLWLVAAGVF